MARKKRRKKKDLNEAMAICDCPKKGNKFEFEDFKTQNKTNHHNNRNSNNNSRETELRTHSV